MDAFIKHFDSQKHLRVLLQASIPMRESAGRRFDMASCCSKCH